MRHARILGLALATAFALGCQPAPSGNSTKFGRLAFGSPAQQPKLGSTQTTTLTNGGGDQAMTQVAALFAAPALNDLTDYQLGTVRDGSGVRFWGEVYLIGDPSSATPDPNQSRLHIEVSDSRVGQSDGNGGTLQPFVVHVGYDNPGFEGVEGGISGGTVALRFDQSGYGSVLVTGQVSGNQFSGQISFVNTYTNGDQVTLGNFTVPTCSFFICQ